MKKLSRHHGRKLGMVILLTTSFAVWAADVDFYGVVKMQRFTQGNAAAPALVQHEDAEGEPAFVFNAFVDLGSSNAATSATLTLPGGAVRTLPLEEDGFHREFFDGAEFKPDLDLIYANGTYTLALQTQNDGNKSLPLTLPASDAYPNPPRISNFTAAQSVNAAANFTLTWDAFAGGLATDFVQLEIAEWDTEITVFETSGPGEPGSLNGTSTSVQIPAGTLSPGRTYRGRIFFARLVDSDDTTYGGGVTGVAGFLTETTFEIRTTGGTDTTPPLLEALSPSTMQGEVKGNAVVAFTFNERMDTALSLGTSIGWSGNVNAGLMNYNWSSEGRTLFCIYGPGLPTDAQISWQLNPGGSPGNLRDLAGNQLPTQSGSFNTGSETGAGETDMANIFLIKGRIFRQFSSTAEAVGLQLFGLTCDLNTLNGVTNGLLTLPNARTVAPALDYGDAFDFEALYSSQAQMDSFFPDGAYQARFDTVHDGPRTFNLTLTGSTYPNAPQVLDFAGTQSVNPSNDFVLSWDAFTGGTAGDYIGLELESDDEFSSNTFEMPGVNEPGALNGTNTSVTIPAFTFAPGRTYRGELFFVKVVQVDTNTYPGVMAAAAYFTTTFFELRTSGQPIRPVLQISTVSSSTARITVTGEKNRFYTVESADDLSGNPVQWMWRASGVTYTNFDGFTASFEFDDYISPGGRRFYRAREGSDFGGGDNP
jgi:hypothetical protein